MVAALIESTLSLKRQDVRVRAPEEPQTQDSACFSTNMGKKPAGYTPQRVLFIDAM